MDGIQHRTRKQRERRDDRYDDALPATKHFCF
jgi:hypothetical protein